MKLQRIFFAWYDFWVGWYYDRDNRVLYVNPLPMLVFKFVRQSKAIGSAVGDGLPGSGGISSVPKTQNPMTDKP